MARELRRSRTTETMKVSIAPLFGEVKEYTLPVGATCQEALEAGNYDLTAEIRLTGDGVLELDTKKTYTQAPKPSHYLAVVKR